MNTVFVINIILITLFNFYRCSLYCRKQQVLMITILGYQCKSKTTSVLGGKECDSHFSVLKPAKKRVEGVFSKPSLRAKCVFSYFWGGIPCNGILWTETWNRFRNNWLYYWNEGGLLLLGGGKETLQSKISHLVILTSFSLLL